MISKTKYLTAITAFSLLCLFSLQLYFLYTTYQGEKEEFIKDINASFELALPIAQKAREDEVHRLHVRDITDTTLLKIEWDTSDPTKSAFKVKDPETGNVVLTYSYTKDEQSDTIRDVKDKIFDLFMGMGRKERIYFGLTDEVDSRRAAYFDTVSLDMEILKTSLNDKLEEVSIPTSYRFAYLDSLTSAADFGTVLHSKQLSAHDHTEEVLMIVFDSPMALVLARMPFILSASVIVILLIAISFVSLFRTIGRQRKLSTMKDDFIDSMTHELLTPIATLKLSLETLDNESVRTNEEKASKYLNISKLELSRVSDIVHNVLYSSLHEQQETKLKIERVNLNDVLDDLVNYHSKANEGGVEINYQKLEEPWVSTDRLHLTNVLHNLIDNGIKYTSGQANITIIPTRDQKELSIVVNDNGCGIPESEQSRVFDKFYRAKDVQDIKGLGVGLYYVKTIMNRLQGNIEILNSSSKGSSFRVSLKA